MYNRAAQLVLSSLLLRSVAEVTRGQNKQETANAAVSDYCHERMYAEALVTQMNTWLTAADINAAAATADYRKMALAAARYKGTEKEVGYAVLLTLAGVKAQAAAKDLADKTPAIRAALEALNRKIAELAALEAISGTAFPSPATAEISADGYKIFEATAKVCSVKVTPTQKTSLSCKDSNGSHARAQTIAQAIGQITKLALRPAANIKLPELTIAAEVKGRLDASQEGKVFSDAAGCQIKSGPDGKKAAGDGIAFQEPRFKTGFAKAELDFAAVKNGGMETRQTTDGDTIALLTPDSVLVSTMENLKGKVIVPATRLTELDDSSILSDDATGDMLEAQHQQSGEELKETDKNKLARQLFGGDKVKIKEQFFDSLTKDSVTIGSGDKEIKGTTEQLSKNHFKKAMAYYNTLNLKKAVAASTGENPKEGEQATKAGAGERPNAESKKCSDRKTEGDCKDGCKWDGEECKDSSILVAKQFAISVVSAAFVALLF